MGLLYWPLELWESKTFALIKILLLASLSFVIHKTENLFTNEFDL